MANDLNQCNFIGRVGKEVTTRYMPSGGAVTNFSIACNWKSKEKEGVEWINIVAFGKLAEICEKYLHKGSKIFLSGSFRTRKWQDKDGNDRYTTEIVADKMQLLDSKPESTQQAPAVAGEPDFDDSIPF